MSDEFGVPPIRETNANIGNNILIQTRVISTTMILIGRRVPQGLGTWGYSYEDPRCQFY